MRKFPAIPKPLLAVLATLFAATTILYSGLWMYYNSWQPPVQLGFDNEHLQAEHCDLLIHINKGSPAEKAGLRAGDRILKVDGQRLENAYSLADIWAKHKPGDAVELTIQRPDVPAPFVIRAVFRAFRSPSTGGELTGHLDQDIINTFPVAFLVVGLAVLFLRLEDPNAWLLALMFAGTIAVPDFPSGFQPLGPYLRRFAMADRAIFNSFNPAFFYFFFAVFPVRSPLDRRASWLKWVGLALGFLMAVPGLDVGAYQTPAVVSRVLGQQGARLVRLCYGYGFIALGLFSLVGNALGTSTPEARRKIRVILWGTLVGVVPIMLALGAQDFFGFHMSLWMAAVLVVLLYLFPLSFAYAVVKHRVLEIPVLFKRSARYVLVQRGFVFLTILWGVGFTGVFTSVGLSLAHLLPWGTEFTLPGVVVAAVSFGSLLALAGTRVHRQVTQKIDSAFFRSAYDARVILQELGEQVRTANGRRELASLLERQIRSALHPVTLAIYFETTRGLLTSQGENVLPEFATIPEDSPEVAELERLGKPQDVSLEASGTPRSAALASLRPECLVPLLGREGKLIGLLVLGPRLSQEPYSGEDKGLLASVASQAGIALEAIRLGEQIAERIEAERRAAQEMEYAKQVQARLFPQKLPPLETLEYAGGCIQARQVGGDYYDFLELRAGRLALVLADIAGKGISGALLMANLQANLRSQYAAAWGDLPRLLKSVNQLFYENTSESSYATLFFADYDDSSRQLRYGNCGHLPPLVLRTDGRLKRLTATATVLGLFEEWECSVAEVQLAPGDTLVLYTDGVTEAESAEGEEFGEARLIETLRAQRHLPVNSLLDTIVATVQQFSNREQADDITLVVARCRDRLTAAPDDLKKTGE
jgi:sigma-B regulation protein RsbU (phosphoserine phosphatase)